MAESADWGSGKNHTTQQNYICFCVLCQVCIKEVTKMSFLLTEAQGVKGDTTGQTIPGKATGAGGTHGIASGTMVLEHLFLSALHFQVIG